MKPPVNVRELAGMLRELAELVRAGSTDATAALSRADALAERCESIGKQKTTLILEGPMEVLGSMFKLADGTTLPIVIFSDKDGDQFAMGFRDRNSAMQAAGAFTALAMIGEYGSDGTAH